MASQICSIKQFRVLPLFQYKNSCQSFQIQSTLLFCISNGFLLLELEGVSYLLSFFGHFLCHRRLDKGIVLIIPENIFYYNKKILLWKDIFHASIFLFRHVSGKTKQTYMMTSKTNLQRHCTTQSSQDTENINITPSHKTHRRYHDVNPNYKSIE